MDFGFGKIPGKYNPFDEQGRVGQLKYAGVFFEEFQKELVGRSGVEVYKEMADGDDVIGAMLFAIEMLVRQVRFEVEPGGDSEEDEKAADFVKGCMDDMQQTWQDTLSEILSFLPYGWSYHEICYKWRMGKKSKKSLSSKFDDGLIGWQKLPIRAQDTLWRWEYDEDDELIGMSQMAPPDYQIRFIPLSKALHFITKSRKWNPEGKSILRNAYRSYYYKKRFQEVEGVGVERDLAGLPMLQPPEDIDIWDADDPDMLAMRASAEKLIQNVRRDAVEGVLIPPGWTFSLISGGSKRQFEIGTIIDRYDKRMAMTAMADFILLGSGAVGSFALSSDKTDLFGVALGTYLDIICEVFNNQAIPALIELNQRVKGAFKGLKELPKMVHSDVEKADLDKTGNFLEKMIGVGLITPDAKMEQYVRRMADLPDPVEGDVDEDNGQGQRQNPNQQPQQNQPQQQTAQGAQNPGKGGQKPMPGYQSRPAQGADQAGAERAAEKAELKEKMRKAWMAGDPGGEHSSED